MDDTRVTNLSMTELVNGCRSEVLAFRRGGALAGGCGYELFRRAVVDRDEPSWHALQPVPAAGGPMVPDGSARGRR
jgi:hypothetical protein